MEALLHKWKDCSVRDLCGFLLFGFLFFHIFSVCMRVHVRVCMWCVCTHGHATEPKPLAIFMLSRCFTTKLRPNLSFIPLKGLFPVLNVSSHREMHCKCLFSAPFKLLEVFAGWSEVAASLWPSSLSQ